MTLTTAVLVGLVSGRAMAVGPEPSPDAPATDAHFAPVRALIDQALERAGANPGNLVLQTGTGAVLRFGTCDQAIRFTRELQASSPRFRAGIGTGDLLFDPQAANGPALAGTALVHAVRLEAQAGPGSVVIDAATWNGASPEQRQGFGGPETIAGKRGEAIAGYRAQFNSDAARQSGPTHPPGDVLRAIVDRDKADLAWEIRRLGHALRREQFDFLLILLDMPAHRRPSDRLTIEQQLLDVMRWAKEDPDGLADLHRELVRISSG